MNEDEIRRIFGRPLQATARQRLTQAWTDGMFHIAAYLQVKRERAVVGLPMDIIDYPAQCKGWTGGCAEAGAEDFSGRA